MTMNNEDVIDVRPPTEQEGEPLAPNEYNPPYIAKQKMKITH